MSIYSGFATRQQQQVYDSYLESLINLLQRRILKLYRKQEVDQTKFASTIRKLHSSMRKMEKYKYLEPKLSFAFSEIVEYFGESKEENRGTSRSELHSLSNMGLNEPVHSVQVRVIPPPPPPMENEIKMLQQYKESSLKHRGGTTDAFRIKRPMTTKYSSVGRRRSSELNVEFESGHQSKHQDDSIKQVLDHYLNGKPNPKLTRNQKNYLKHYKKHKNQLSHALQQHQNKV